MNTDDITFNWPPVLAIGAAVLAIVLSIFALGRALAMPGGSMPVGSMMQPAAATGAADAAGAEDAADAVGVALTEFAIAPAELEAVAGSVLAVRNDGAVPHNLTIRGTELATVDLAGGDAADLPLGELDPGSYAWFCSVPGHEASGMAGTLTVTDGVATTSDTSASTDGAVEGDSATASAAELEATMAASIAAFPAATEGVGAAVLEPTILPDGTKLFELTADELPWEVEPGKVVDAVGYNGMVPGPTMYADVGDRVTIRVTNQLDDEGTSFHPHGLKDHAFELDGVTYISQDPIAPGESMDYTFVADQESVVGYHSHHMSLHQVPDGLFGMMIIGDYAALAGIEGVVDEQVMVLNDAGAIGLSLNGKSFPATTPYSYKAGDKVVVHYANEGQMAHPMHLHNQAGTVIAKDGYLLPEGARYQGDTFTIAPGERLTVVYDMKTPGTWVWHCHILSHVKQTDGSMFGMLTAVVIEE